MRLREWCMSCVAQLVLKSINGRRRRRDGFSSRCKRPTVPETPTATFSRGETRRIVNNEHMQFGVLAPNASHMF